MIYKEKCELYGNPKEKVKEPGEWEAEALTFSPDRLPVLQMLNKDSECINA